MPLADLFKMARGGNVLIAIVSLAAGYFLSRAAFSWGGFAADAIAFAFAIAFGNILNDILDVETDRVNRPERAIPSGRVSPKGAAVASAVCAFCTLACAFFPGTNAPFHFGFYSALLILLFLYDRLLKRIPLVKNATVALLCATPLVRSMLLPGADLRPLYPAIGFAFLFTLAREIQKDLEDADGDLKAGIATFPLIAGERRAQTLSAALVVFAWISLPVPVVLGWYRPAFLFSLLPLFPLVLAICLRTYRKNYHAAQRLSKISMVVGLAALILANL